MSGLIVLLGGAMWLEYYKKWLPLVVIFADAVFMWLLPSSAVPPDPLTIRKSGSSSPTSASRTSGRRVSTPKRARRLATLSGPPSGQARLLLWPEAAITEPVEDARADQHRGPPPFPARPAPPHCSPRTTGC